MEYSACCNTVSEYIPTAEIKSKTLTENKENEVFTKVWYGLFADTKVSASTLRPGTNSIMLNVPYIPESREKESDIKKRDVHSVIEMVLAYYKKDTNVGEITDLDISCCHCIFRRKGLKSMEVTNGTVDLINHELENRRPVIVRWKANGTILKPTGEYHWSVIIGKHNDCWIHNDPMGLADLENGGYITISGGKQAIYENNKWLPRWIIDNQSLCILAGDPGV